LKLLFFFSGELSSISGSDTEEENDDLEPTSNFIREISEEEAQQEVSIFARHPTKRFYITEDFDIISLYRNAIVEVKLRYQKYEKYETTQLE